VSGTVLALLLAAYASAQPPGKTVLGGVYTAAQAKHGQAVYERSCGSCHRADLGGFSGPPLKGDLFLDRWREFSLNVLSDLIQNTMPADNPGTLAKADYLDVLAYILQANEIPSGKKPLTADLLAGTLLVGKDGPKPLPTSAQVAVVGCVTLDTGNGWFLTHSSEPARTLTPWEISAEELKTAKDQALGDQLFRLQNITEVPGFDRDKMNGAKAEAKGILVRQPNNERINVMSLQSVGESCEQ
jgi:mono/diheme cytochrome c family protein